MARNSAKYVRVSLSGVNLNKIYRECKKKDIEMFNINRKDYKNIEFDIKAKNKKLLKDIAKFQRYNYAEKQNFGHTKLLNFLKFRFGILIGIVFFVFINFVSSFFVWNIEIYGNQSVSNQEILNALSQNNIAVGKSVSNVTLQNIETNLTNSLDNISLCSVIKKGTTIIVNIKEKLATNSVEYINGNKDIVATTNMTIVEIKAQNGTILKKAGDSVKAGDVIVAGYIFDANGNKISCNANASIKAKTWHTATEVYQNKVEKKTRTGNKISNAYITFFDMKFDVKNNQNEFENFETEQTTTLLSNNNFLPVYLNTTTFFETTSEMIFQNFEQDKSAVLERCQSLAYSKVQNGETVTKVFDVIEQEQDSFVVTSYVEVVFEY